MPTLHVGVRSAEWAYPIEIAEGVAARLQGLLDLASVPARRFVVSSPTVWRFHGHLFEDISSDPPILIPDGERHKHLGTVGRIYDGLIAAGADRACTLVAIGGGVVGDIGGFAAATFLRGVPVVQVPTTLLAQVDSAIGGKTGVNHVSGKNLIGAFHAPSVVAIDPVVLTTLPRREFRAGLYEVVKYGVIASQSLFEAVSNNLRAIFSREPEALLPIIAESCRIKASVVEQDERESGLRRMLNFGHTAGHALEAVTKFRRFRHGEAVAYGMLTAAELAVGRGALPAADRDRLAALITQMGPLPAISDIAATDVLRATVHDKKLIAGELHFVLPTSIGTVTTVTDVSAEEFLEALAAVGFRRDQG